MPDCHHTHDLLGRVSGGESLPRETMAAVIGAIMEGEWRENEIALLLTALSAKGETAEELAGAADALRRHMTPVRTSRDPLVDTCGTGGAGSGTFNVSTAAAIVTAAAGVAVSKHGNRKVTSKSGSADVLAELGVNIEAPIEVVERCLDELGICFCFAVQHHPAMRHVASVRRNLGRPTIFNLLGPLCNPAGAPFQLLGAGRPETRHLLAEALAQLGTRRSIVVSGRDGLGEITTADATDVVEVAGGALRELSWTPEDFGVARCLREAILAADPPASAQIVRRILAGETGPPRDIVVANAAAAIWLVDEAATLAGCARRAAEAIDSGAARNTLENLSRISNA